MELGQGIGLKDEQDMVIHLPEDDLARDDMRMVDLCAIGNGFGSKFWKKIVGRMRFRADLYSPKRNKNLPQRKKYSEFSAVKNLPSRSAAEKIRMIFSNGKFCR